MNTRTHARLSAYTHLDRSLALRCQARAQTSQPIARILYDESARHRTIGTTYRLAALATPLSQRQE